MRAFYFTKFEIKIQILYQFFKALDEMKPEGLLMAFYNTTL